MKKVIFVLLAMSVPLFAQTTYQQNQEYSWRSGFTATTDYMSTYGLQFTAADGAVVQVSSLQVFPTAAYGGYACYTSPDGVSQPCAPKVSTTFGSSMSVSTTMNGQTYNCTGPSSADLVFKGVSLNFTFTYEYRWGRYSGCFAKTLTGALRLN